MKQIIKRIPEVFFIGLALFWLYDNYTASGLINYYASAIIMVLSFQIVFQKPLVGMFLGVMLGIFSLYMILAVLSDVFKYNEITGKDIEYLLTAGGIFGIGVVMATGMVYKFAIARHNYMKLRSPVSV